MLTTVGVGLSAAIAGCSWGPSFPEADVLAGPDGRLVFEPEALTVAVGETVTWGFASSGHNVACRPTQIEAAKLPNRATPFASFDDTGSPRSTVPQGETYSRDFDVPGTYNYVCAPHVSQGMVGTIHVDATR